MRPLRLWVEWFLALSRVPVMAIGHWLSLAHHCITPICLCCSVVFVLVSSGYHNKNAIELGA